MSNRTDKELKLLEERLYYLKCELDLVTSDIDANEDAYLADELFDQKDALYYEIQQYEAFLKKEHDAYIKAIESLEVLLKEETERYKRKEQREFRFIFWRDSSVDPLTIPQLAAIVPEVFSGRHRKEQLIIRLKVYQEFPHIYNPKIRFASWKYAGRFRDLFITLANGQKDLAKKLFLSWISP